MYSLSRSPGPLGQPHPAVPGGLNGVYTSLLTVEMSSGLSESKRGFTGPQVKKSLAPSPHELVFHDPWLFFLHHVHSHPFTSVPTARHNTPPLVPQEPASP